MTTEQLERKLETLAQPRAEDERLRLAIRASLSEELRRRPKARRRSRVAIGSAALAAATAAAAIVALIGTGGSGIRIIKGTSDQLHEGAREGAINYSYDAGTDTIYQQPSSKAPTLTDPVETVRAELTSGTANVAGTVTINGQSLYKIELPNGVVGYFDQTSFRPVYLDNPQGDRTVVRTHVLAYEELPLTSENEKLVSLTAQHPDARVETIAAPTK